MRPNAKEQYNILNKPLKKPPTINTIITTLNTKRNKLLKIQIRTQALLNKDLRDLSTKLAVVATSFDDIKREFNI